MATGVLNGIAFGIAFGLARVKGLQHREKGLFGELLIVSKTFWLFQLFILFYY
jgi:hypothetical protein